jgi:hypothetical protein
MSINNCCSILAFPLAIECFFVMYHRLIKAARVFFGVLAVFFACDVLHFLGGPRPPTDGQAWKRLAANEEDNTPGGPASRKQPIIIYDRHKNIIAQFASSAGIPLSEVRPNTLCLHGSQELSFALQIHLRLVALNAESKHVLQHEHLLVNMCTYQCRFQTTCGSQWSVQKIGPFSSTQAWMCEGLLELSCLLVLVVGAPRSHSSWLRICLFQIPEPSPGEAQDSSVMQFEGDVFLICLMPAALVSCPAHMLHAETEHSVNIVA